MFKLIAETDDKLREKKIDYKDAAAAYSLAATIGEELINFDLKR